MSITFYTSQSSIGVATHIALEESGLEYQLVEVDFTKQQQSDQSYLKINPKARVPSLVVQQGILTETPAILNYLAQCAPNSSIALPDDIFANALIQSFNSYLCSTVHVAHAHKMRGRRWVDDAQALSAITDNVPKTVALCFDMIEMHMLKSPWVHGSRFSISDPYLYRMSTWLEGDGVDIDRYPLVKAHRERMASRASVKAVEAFFKT
ncbi:MAG: glutathione S-transferase family protein [Granulosicoccus sp.]